MSVRLAVAFALLACLWSASAPAALPLWQATQPQAAAPLCDLFANGFDVPTTQACASCFDGVADNLEPDIDCGGPYCAACADLQHCAVSNDCQSGVCSGGLCQTPTCSDGVRNGSETDVDCGGPLCTKCGDGKQCSTDIDCASSVCDPVTYTCQAPSCTDGLKNGLESDVDCGGPLCPKCAVGKQCMVGSDCLSNHCAFGLCQP